MEEARVVINLKAGIIELQGPVDFVRHYLDTYQPSIKGLQSLQQDVAKVPEKADDLRRKRKAATVARREKRNSFTGAIRNDLETGFFDEPHSAGEIKQRLREAGLNFTDSGVRGKLEEIVSGWIT